MKLFIPEGNQKLDYMHAMRLKMSRCGKKRREKGTWWNGLSYYTWIIYSPSAFTKTIEKALKN